MSVVLPWYERDPAGVWTGREWATKAEACAEAAPGCSVHVEIATLVEPASFRSTRYSRRVSDVAVREWHPRGWGGTD